MEQTMLYCTRYSGAFDSGFQEEDKEKWRNGDKEKSPGFIFLTQHCHRLHSHCFDCGFRIADFGLKEIREVLQTRGSAVDFGFQSEDQEPLKARRALNGEAFELLNGKAQRMENQQQ